MSIYEIGLFIAYGLLALGTLSLLVGMIRTVMHDRISGLQTIGGIILILVIFGIGYATASGALTPEAIADGITSNQMKIYDGGLKTLYVLISLALIALFADIIKNVVQGG